MGGRMGKIVAGLMIVIGIGAVAVFVLRRPVEPPPQPASLPPLVAVAPPPKDEPLPPRDVSDGRLRGLFAALSPLADWARWLAADDLLTRLVAVVDNVAEGSSPRAHLPFLAPGSHFRTVERGGRDFVSPESHARYDGFAAVIASLDVKACAASYEVLHPLLDAAYHAFGYPGRPFAGVVSQALARVRAVPITGSDLELVSKGGLYLYADPQLEALSPVEKHLLRMGPRNVLRIQEKARALEAALGLSKT